MTISSGISKSYRAGITGRWPVGVLAALLLMIAAMESQASPSAPNYNGHYELADAKADRSFVLDVKQIKQRADVTFSAAMSDGSGAAPDGAGQGKVEDGVLSFKFKDSYNNEGTCTLQPGKSGYQLNIVVTRVVEPRPFHFYGNVLLKKMTP